MIIKNLSRALPAAAVLAAVAASLAWGAEEERPDPTAPPPAGGESEIISAYPPATGEAPPAAAEPPADATGLYPASLAARPTDYVIGPGDALNIRVIGEPELTATYTVRLNGRIMFPYLGEIPVAGIGISEFNHRLQKDLAAIYKDPQVVVEVAGYGSCVVYVLGEVEKPGVYKFEGTTTLLEVITVAGGYKHSAARASTMVVRSYPADATVMRVNMEKMIEGGAVNLNIPVTKGDVVVVPRTFIADLNQFLVDITPSIGAYLNAISVYKTTRDINR